LESANLLGVSEGGAIARHLAAEHPSRIEAVALLNTMAPLSEADRIEELSGEHHVTTEQQPEAWTRIAGSWGEDVMPFIDLLCPSQATNTAFVRWMGRFNRLAVSPADFGRQLAAVPDLVAEIPKVPAHIPTTIVQVKGDRANPVGNGRVLAAMMPSATYVEVDGTDHPVIGQYNRREIMDQTVELFTGQAPPTSTARELAVVLFTDIVGSTELATTLGDRRWRELIEAHDQVVHRTVNRHRGRVATSTGDGVLATFSLPSDAIDATVSLRAQLTDLGIGIRAGLHTGEIEVHADLDISGITVNIAARIEASGSRDQIQVSSGLKDMLLGTPHVFADGGTHLLKGVDGSWPLFSLQ
jgi:class 3 adenylate cyclase